MNLEKNLNLACEVAVKAGVYLKGLNNYKVEKEFGRDIKLNADKESENIIIRTLKSKSYYSILSEETNSEDFNLSGVHWIVDPLDGSLNFLRGLEQCAVSIALWENNSPLLGVIYDFNKNDLYSCIVNKFSRLNEKEIIVSKIDKKEKGVISTGLPPEMDFSENNIKKLINNFQLYKKTRLFGCPSLSLAYVASGKIEAYSENPVKLWDVAAGLALVKSAGGDYKMNKLDKKYYLDIFASNGKINF